jgi:hypothetical protein
MLERITAVSTLWISYFPLSASGINYGSRIASFIDFLAQVFLRILMVRMIRLSRVASWSGCYLPPVA